MSSTDTLIEEVINVFLNKRGGCALLGGINVQGDPGRLLQILQEGTSTETGLAFIDRITRHLCESFNIRMGFVAKVVEDGRQAQILSCHLDGKTQPPFDYELAGTPCLGLYTEGMLYYPLFLREKYPSTYYEKQGFDTFFGMPLFDRQKQTIGHFSFFHTGEIENFEIVTAVLALFGARIAAEMERLAIADELENTQAELLETAIQVGKSYLANQVLHNVSNVLNSLNTSLSMAREDQVEPNLVRLERALDLLEANTETPGFLASDKGKQLLGYLRTIREDMSNKAQHLFGELDQMTRHLQHIQTIISTQQSSHHGALDEWISPQAVIDDALLMTSNSLKRHRVKLCIDIQDPPHFRSSRHHLLQILVNLIKNGVEALDHNPPDQRKMTIKGVQRGSFYQLSVQDNGVGIGPESMKSLFQYGFTTKQSGHGFGLHSCQRLAEELGGKISCESEGCGQGATFKLSVPIKAG